ncbi:MAG: HU family DNA-binding protein [Prevotellamassilia sp.]|nr:HU family DNA-binding protein [Prevotellamassilia sp.]
MEKKLLLQEVADLLATKTGISRKAADNFSRLFFDLIVEGLTKDKYVKIKGLGTFKIVSVGERESINIHTGERIQISGHNKITFTQDPFIKDLVNKPFAHFQTVPLNDETELSELEEVDKLSAIQSNTTEEEDETQEELTEEPVAMPEELPTENHEAADTPEEVESQPAATTSTPQDDILTETVPETDEDTSEEGEQPQPDIVEEITEEPKKVEVETTATQPKETEVATTDEQPTTAEETKSEEIESEKIEVEDVGPSKTYTVQSVGGHGGNHGPVDFVVEIRSDKRLAKWKMIALILFVIIMMGAAYCIGYYRVLTPNANQAAQPEVTEAKTVKPQTHNTAATTNQVETKKAAEKDSTAKADKAQTTQAQQKSTAGKPEQVQTKQEQAQPQPAQPRYHIVKSGENLNGIAKKVYGSKSYASLIIKANHIKNPDLVDVGTKLILPEVNDKQQ